MGYFVAAAPAAAMLTPAWTDVNGRQVGEAGPSDVAPGIPGLLRLRATT